MPTPRNVNGNFKGQGVSKAQFFERKYDTKMEFPEGWRVQFKKTFRGRGMDIFWNDTLTAGFTRLMPRQPPRFACASTLGRMKEARDETKTHNCVFFNNRVFVLLIA